MGRSRTTHGTRHDLEESLPWRPSDETFELASRPIGADPLGAGRRPLRDSPVPRRLLVRIARIVASDPAGVLRAEEIPKRLPGSGGRLIRGCAGSGGVDEEALRVEEGTLGCEKRGKS